MPRRWIVVAQNLTTADGCERVQGLLRSMGNANLDNRSEAVQITYGNPGTANCGAKPSTCTMGTCSSAVRVWEAARVS